ncbi:GPALPP motifs-containing protein 1-like isoform X2 [Anneissia japonica]|uniref:GPALPP motifs-containing protein 1-like isoform X2 n=1 Tax=Anneissia japonica TaxID=1529436 RepID=UPI0014254C93|nr:GPALPP motifs-containing protein 1-like isoform X2 [Anneissia japonica]
MSGDNIGPILPPSFSRPSTYSDGSTSDTEATIGPALPPNFRSNKAKNTSYIGPVLPQSTSNVTQNRNDLGVSVVDPINEISSSCTTNRTLSPGSSCAKTEPCSFVSSSQGDMCYGPALPPGFKQSVEVGEPIEEDDDTDDDMIGPMPATGNEVSSSSVASEFEARAEAMKNRLTGKSEEKVERETWMMELPDYGKNFGLGPRTFRKNAAPSKQDRSGWTETPADREKRIKDLQEKAMSADSTSKHKKNDREEKSKRDQEIEERISTFNQNTRGTSLVDMHQKELKRKMQEDDNEPQERRPFDREVDLQVNRFDDAKKKRLLKESAKLNDKFSHGSDRVYL